MPILWRYLMSSFLKIVMTCVLAFIAILLTMRLDEIAHFAALGAPLNYLFIFVLHQIPYILPVAIPLSCLIASLILIQTLSNSYELTALRASGFAMRDILAPILLVAAFLSIGNFWITSEVATQSHLQSNLLKSELRSINPLLLLHNKHLMKLKGFYFETLGDSHVGESVSDAILAIPNKHQHRLTLMVAKKLKASPSVFIGQNMTIISGSPGEEEDFDHLFIENIGKSKTHVQDFSDILQKKVWTINNDYLKLPLLLARLQEQQERLNEALSNQAPAVQIKSLKTQLNRCHTEIIKRFSIALASFSFTLMGTAFAINISRQRRHYPLYLVIALTTFFLISFFVAKSFDQQLYLASALYIIPHFFIILSSIIVLRKITRGIE